jgi:NADH:ubiquinone oxidoreductase subunit F (NADH-binding)
VSGAVARPGVVEVATGTTIAEILEVAGRAPELSAALVGGYGGAWVAAGDFDCPYAPGPLARLGASMGAGVLVALPTARCGWRETARIARYLAGQSAGQCGPCVFGLPAIADDLERIADGAAGESVGARLERRRAAVVGRGACRHPDGAARLVASAGRVFAADLADHLAGRPCAGAAPPPVLGPSARRPEVAS